MKKLKLHMDALKVESFPTSGRTEQRGTVHAHSHTECVEATCPHTCTNTLWITCSCISEAFTHCTNCHETEDISCPGDC